MSTSHKYSYSILFLLIASFLRQSNLCGANPTDGFTNVPLAEENFDLQRQYNAPLNRCYSDNDGVRSLWVYNNNDKPFKPGSNTRQRTEVIIKGYDYSSGVWPMKPRLGYGYRDLTRISYPYLHHVVSTRIWQDRLTSSGIIDWQFKDYIYVPKGTSGVAIVQIDGAFEGATTLQLRIYDGDMRYYKYNLVATDLYKKWFRVNVIHDVGKGEVTVFIDGEQKFVGKDQGPRDLYFKYGVYAAPINSSNYARNQGG